MRDRRKAQDLSPGQPDENNARFDRERIMLLLIGLAGAVAIFAMNIR